MQVQGALAEARPKYGLPSITISREVGAGGTTVAGLLAESLGDKFKSHHGDPIDLNDIACATHVSTYYFCKIFRKTTSLTFADYLGRVRVEKAKNLLLNPHLRVSEIAYTVGFQSLTHFNRLFHQLTDESPTHFRDRAMGRTKGTVRNLNVRTVGPEGSAADALGVAA